MASSKIGGIALVQDSRIREGMNYLEWSIEEQRSKGLNEGKENVWSRHNTMMQKFFIYKVKDWLLKIGNDLIDMKMIDDLRNILNSNSKSLVIITRDVYVAEEGEQTCVVVGTGVTFSGKIFKKCDFKAMVKVVSEVIGEWIRSFVEQCTEDKNTEALIESWNKEEAEGSGKYCRELIVEEIGKRENFSDLCVKVKASQISELAGEVFANLVQGEVEEEKTDENYTLWYRFRRRKHAGMEKEKARNHTRKEGGEKLNTILNDLKYTCLLENNSILGLLGVYNESTWEVHCDMVMNRAWDGVSFWPFVSFDSEGSGIWYQVGFYTHLGWNCSVFGPRFFPAEMMALLESKLTIVTGKTIHKDLSWVLGKQVGWRAVDLGVWSRDLLYHGHHENGLKRMIQEALGFNMKKLVISKKSEDSDKEKYGYIRAGNWDCEFDKLDSRMLVYMASDVTLTGTVVFDILISLVEELGVDVLDKKFQSIEEFVGPYVRKVADRKINEKLQDVKFKVELHERSMVNSTAAVRLSIDLHECVQEAEAEDEEQVAARRKVIMRQIKESSTMAVRLNYRPDWSKLPQLRKSAAAQLLQEVVQKEESWE